ncbi:unnamed protein product [Linum tenue]|uniref:DUF7032 domain-containing protein n=2 Tax=Linum tenue TaxID=586396 RepID=A0AAV0MIW6_9ROSI|nr:unnamed protein product [Linum tenue]
MTAPETDPVVDGPTRILTSVLEQIPGVVAFKGKWAVIKSKLDDLHTLLLDSSDFPASTSNLLFLDLLRSISHTLDDAALLAAKCQSSNFLSEGKLKTQSDLDSVLARLDRHVSDGELLIRSGVLHDVFSGSSSKRDAVRAESRNLLTRLQIGGAESRNSAIDSLLRLLGEDDKNVMIAVAQGIVPVLVRLLDSNSWEMKEKTVAAISRVSMVESSKHALIAEGLPLLNHLIRILESGTGFAKEKACIALQSLTLPMENARAIGSRGGISSLLDICQAGTPASQAFAAGVLRNLAAVEETRENFMEENAVYVLMGLAASGTPSAQENAFGCLSSLVKEDDELKVLIVKEGGMECLSNFWESCPPVRCLEAALQLISHLASNEAIAEVLVSHGFVSKVTSVLNCEVLGVRVAAAKAVYQLGYSSRSRKEMGGSAEGCVSLLIRMLDGKGVEEKEAAAMALSRLVLCPGNRRVFRKDERGLVTAVQLLDPNVENLDKRYPIAILSSLVHSSKCAKQMVAAGACLHLRSLVDMEVEGAKKLLEGLGKGKIWGVFARP